MEMERDCIISHGTAKFLKERFSECSDGFDCYVCDITGLICFGNPHKRYFYSKGADNYTSITKLKIPYAFKQFLYECMTIGISPRLITNQAQL
jgi:DNA-directed RNA polymerase II subunit RPB2